MSCPITHKKSALFPGTCQLKEPVKAPVKAPVKTPVVKTSGFQHSNPTASLKLVTGGKAQAKPVAKSGDVVLSEDKIQAKPKLKLAPTPKQAAAKKAQVKKLIDDFGMIAVAKSSGKEVKRSVWGRAPLPSQSAAKQRPAKH